MHIQPDAFAALRYRDFSIVTLNQFCLTLAILIQEIIVAYSLYQITKDPLTLGLIGLAEAIPFISLSLWGGYVADRFNKQTIMKICLFLPFRCLSFSGHCFIITAWETSAPVNYLGEFMPSFSVWVPFVAFIILQQLH
jgi:Bacterial protein of unknown function (DUF894).